MAGLLPSFGPEVISARPLEGELKMSVTENLNPNGSSHKESTHSRTAGGKSLVGKLPDAARSSEPNKVRVINVCQKRDALAIAQVTAATVIPSNVTQQWTFEQNPLRSANPLPRSGRWKRKQNT